MHRRKRKILGISNFFNEGNTMRKDCKDNLIAEAHRNPEYAKMSAVKLAKIIDADQSTISVWRRRMKETTSLFKVHKTKQSEEKNKFDALSDRLRESYIKELREEISRLDKDLSQYKYSHKILDDLLTEKNAYIEKLESRSWIQRLFNSKV